MIATVCGVYGISFVIVAVNACVVAAFLLRTGRAVTVAMLGIVIATAFTSGEVAYYKATWRHPCGHAGTSESAAGHAMVAGSV